jgi:PPOX class probable F420-dependent enzyme
MGIDLDDDTREFIRHHRVARLATADTDGQPAVVPICYAFDGVAIYSAIDEKPKRVEPHSLKRVRNIEANPRVSMVIDDYSEEWSELAFLMIAGRAEIIEPDQNLEEHMQAIELLRDKYPQYRSMAIDKRALIKITPTRIRRWAAKG